MKKKAKTYTGINIQYPISQLILSGDKTVETRTYPMPGKMVGVPLVFVETPGRFGKFKSRLVALITFGESFAYKNAEEFYLDERHLVDRFSKWAWEEDKPKWGWPIIAINVFSEPQRLGRRPGIVYSKDIVL